MLSRKHTLNPSVVDPLRESPGSAGRCILVANLPYNAATPLIMNLLASEPQVKRLCFTVQKEVGDRMTASVGTKAFGPLAIAVQTTCDLRRIARVPATAFWPAPNVESVMLRLDRKRHPFENGDTLSDFLELVHAAFAHRRKTLRFNLERSLDEAALATAAGLLDMSKRAETVSVRSWIEVGVTLVGGSGVD